MGRRESSDAPPRPVTLPFYPTTYKYLTAPSSALLLSSQPGAWQLLLPPDSTPLLGTFCLSFSVPAATFPIAGCPQSGALAVDAWHLCHQQPHGGVPRSLHGWIGGLRDEWADRWRKQGRQGWRGGWMDGWVVGPHPAHGSSTTGAHSSAGQRRVPKFHQQHSLLPSRSVIKTSTAARLPQACARTAAVPDCNHFGGSPADPVVNPPSRD